MDYDAFSALVDDIVMVLKSGDGQGYVWKIIEEYDRLWSEVLGEDDAENRCFFVTHILKSDGDNTYSFVRKALERKEVWIDQDKLVFP